MQYHEYISAYNARRERERQLNQYEQEAAGKSHDMTGNELVSICTGLVIVAIVLLLSIRI